MVNSIYIAVKTKLTYIVHYYRLYLPIIRHVDIILPSIAFIISDFEMPASRFSSVVRANSLKKLR